MNKIDERHEPTRIVSLDERNRLFVFLFQKITSTIFLRPLSDSSTDLKKVLAEKIPKEQERVKNFRKQHGSTKVGEVTVDMVRDLLLQFTMQYVPKTYDER